MRIGIDHVTGAALTGLSGLVAALSVQLPIGRVAEPGPGYAPLLLSALLGVLGLVLVLHGHRAPPLGRAAWPELPHALRILLAGAFAALALERLGYRLTVLVVLLVLLGAVERRPPLLAVAVAAGIAFGSHALFAGVLKVPLPVGILGF